jgi:CheY-like chemotaxis protein
MRPILYAEDEADDIFFMRRAFQSAGVGNPLRTVGDGQEVIAYLCGTGQYADRGEHPLPGLVLLDLNMPRMSGFEVLKWIRATPAVSALPILVLTSSNHDSDVQRASLLGANGYIVKPGKPEDLLEIVKAVKSYWLSCDRFAERSNDLS